MRTLASCLLVMSLASSVSAQVVDDVGAFMQAYMDAVAADNFVTQSSLVENNKEKLIAAFMNWEHSWAELKTSEAENAPAGATSTMQILESLASVDNIKGSRKSFLLDRVKWVQNLEAEQVAAKSQAWTTLSALLPEYQRLSRKPEEEDVRKLVTAYGGAFERYKIAGDAYWMANIAQIMAQLSGRIGDHLVAAYWCKRGVDATIDAGHARGAVDELNLTGMATTAAQNGKFRLELLDASLPFEEARAKYDAAVAAAEAELLKPAPGESGGGGVAAARPNKHPEGASRDWMDEKGFKVGPAKKRPPETPCFRENAGWFFWNSVTLNKEQVAPISILPTGSELENDKGKMILHPEGKGKSKSPLRLKVGAKPEMVEVPKVTWPDGSVGSLWFEMQMAPTSYTINGFSLRNSGTASRLLYIGASVATGTVRGVPVAIYDANADGSFDSYGSDYIVIGKGKDERVQPLSGLIELAGLFYEFRVESSGRGVRSRPYDGPVTLLKYEHGCATAPKSMVAQATGELSDFYVDLMNAVEKPIWVVPGVYRFKEGYLSEGSGRTLKTIWVTPGRNEVFKAEEGSANVWKMGGAGEGGFNFVCKPEVKRDGGRENIIIPGVSVRVHGSFGEEYIYPLMGQWTPLVEVRKAKETQVLGKEPMRKPETADITGAESTSESMFYPKNFELKKPFSGDAEIRLTHDYKALGAIDSGWIALQ